MGIMNLIMDELNKITSLQLCASELIIAVKISPPHTFAVAKVDPLPKFLQRHGLIK